MARNEFETEVGRLLSRTFLIAERIDDAAFNREGKRQVKPKPYDFNGCALDGRYWAAEVKRVKSPRFPLANFKEHQHDALRAVQESQGLSWVFINWRIDSVGGTRGTGIAIWVPYDMFYQAVHMAVSERRKSLKPYDFQSIYWLERISGGWEPGPLHPCYKYVLARRNDSWTSSTTQKKIA